MDRNMDYRQNIIDVKDKQTNSKCKIMISDIERYFPLIYQPLIMYYVSDR